MLFVWYDIAMPRFVLMLKTKYDAIAAYCYLLYYLNIL